MALVRALGWLAPRTMEGQMLAILGVSFALLLAALAVLEVRDQEDVVEWAQNDATLSRLRRMKPAVELVSAERLPELLAVTSACHEGYTLTDEPFARVASSAEAAAIAGRIAHELGLPPDRVRVGHARLTRDDFSYRECDPASIDLPADGMVISVRLGSGRWLNAEVHPHEWHVRQDMVAWSARAVGAFVLVGAVAVFFVRHLVRPLAELTSAARTFGTRLEVSEVKEGGPPDLRRAIRSFNDMQRRVAQEVERRTCTLAAISHDVRTPLTALRIKAELVDDEEARRDLIRSVETMERITASALEFLRGECRSEPMRAVDLGALVEGECADFQEVGRSVTCSAVAALPFVCRPDALARALRCLIDNAVKYGERAEVVLRGDPQGVTIAVSDHGPGIPADKLALALAPFERLSPARESEQGGFGLGLAIVQAIARGHEGELVLAANTPTGLVATIRLPGRQATG